MKAIAGTRAAEASGTKRHVPVRAALAFPSGRALAACAALLLAAGSGPIAAQSSPTPPGDADAGTVPPGLTYADLASLAERAQVTLVARIEGQAQVARERAPGLAPGQARLYLEAATEGLLAGPSAVGGTLAFLVDRDVDARGRAPRLKGQRYLLFARLVPGRPGELQLAGPGAMQPASPALVDRARSVLRELAEAPPRPAVTGIREAISVEGNLAGESETQIFLETDNGAPVSLSVIRRPGMAPEWGVSWTEIVDQSATRPLAGTLDWYHLACFLPADLPRQAFLQEDARAQARARDDYDFILEDLGPCDRTIG